jgi:hypothetical protein
MILKSIFISLLFLVQANCEFSISEQISINEHESIALEICDFHSNFEFSLHNRWGQVIYTTSTYSGEINIWEIKSNESKKERKKREKEIKKGLRMDPNKLTTGTYAFILSYINSKEERVSKAGQIYFQ